MDPQGVTGAQNLYLRAGSRFRVLSKEVLMSWGPQGAQGSAFGEWYDHIHDTWDYSQLCAQRTLYAEPGTKPGQDLWQGLT